MALSNGRALEGFVPRQKAGEMEQAEAYLQMWDSHLRTITQVGELVTFCEPQLHKDPFLFCPFRNLPTLFNPVQ